MKRPRVVGTTEDSIRNAEAELGCRFLPSFRLWLFTNNGLGADETGEIEDRARTFAVFLEKLIQGEYETD